MAHTQQKKPKKQAATPTGRAAAELALRTVRDELVDLDVTLVRVSQGLCAEGDDDQAVQFSAEVADLASTLLRAVRPVARVAIWLEESRHG